LTQPTREARNDVWGIRAEGEWKVTIRKATIIVQSDGLHHIEIMDVIEFEGQFWLVPEWLDNTSLEVTMPVRIISLATIRHSRSAGYPEFVVEDPIPKSVFDGLIQSPEARGFVVRERPDIRFPIPPSLH
jgi:hypothetical protein